MFKYLSILQTLAQTWVKNYSANTRVSIFLYTIFTITKTDNFDEGRLSLDTTVTYSYFHYTINITISYITTYDNAYLNYCIGQCQ